MSAEIKYNGETLETLNDGEYVTLHTKDMKMEDDIRVEVEEDPLPIELTTEDAMTAFLNDSPPGSVCKYTGDIEDTYESGGLYIVSEE